MLPVLFSFGPITIYTFGFLLAIGFFLASFIVWRRLRDLGLDEEKVIDFIILAIISGLLFSQSSRLVKNGGPFGIILWGGLMGAVLALAWFSKKEKWNNWQVADEVTFGILPLAILLQIGAFFDGSAVGKPTSMPWGIYFPGSLVRSQPVSLFFALALFLIWLFLLKIERQWRIWSWYKSKNSGFIFLAFLVLALLANFTVAFWQQAKIYWYWAEIGFSLGGAIGAGILFYGRSGRRLREDLLYYWRRRKDDD